MKGSLRKKYTIVGIFLMIIFCSILFLTANLFQKKITSYWNCKIMDNVSQEIFQTIKKEKWDYSKIDVDILAFENNVSVTITDEKFNIKVSTRSWERRKERLGPKSRRIIKQHAKDLQKTGEGFYSDFDDNNYISFVHIRKLQDSGYLILRKSVNGVRDNFLVMQICFAIAAVITLLFGGIFIFYITGKMIKPINEINRITGKIAQLNFDEKVMIKNKDELGELAESVNIMSMQLNDAVKHLKEDVENRKLLVRNMAHELKTPLAVIMGYTENLYDIAYNYPERLSKYSQIISSECERMDSLICRMLEIAQYEDGAQILCKQYFSLEDFLEEIRMNFENDFGKNQKIYIEIKDVSDEILGDREILKDAVYNLLKNAITYGRENGYIRIRIWKNQYIYFGVYNEGKPISEDEKQRMWELFYKSDQSRKRKGKNFGIGLSVVKYVAEAHGGKVWADNKENGVEIGFYISIEK